MHKIKKFWERERYTYEDFLVFQGLSTSLKHKLKLIFSKFYLQLYIVMQIIVRDRSKPNCPHFKQLDLYLYIKAYYGNGLILSIGS